MEKVYSNGTYHLTIVKGDRIVPPITFPQELLPLKQTYTIVGAPGKNRLQFLSSIRHHLNAKLSFILLA